MRKFLLFIGDWGNMIYKDRVLIRKIYIVIRGNVMKVFWRDIICFNFGVFRINIITWFVLYSKIRIKDIVVVWGLFIDL